MGRSCLRQRIRLEDGDSQQVYVSLSVLNASRHGCRQEDLSRRGSSRGEDGDPLGCSVLLGWQRELVASADLGNGQPKFTRRAAGF